MESAVRAAVPLRVGKKMRKRRELDALVGGGGTRGGRLLSASSDEGEPWDRRTTRRRRSKPFVHLAAALALCVCVVSAATVLWLFVDVRRQIVSLRIEMDRVTKTNDGVGDALQICHTTAQEFRANATSLNLRLATLEQNHEELSKRVEQAIKKLMIISAQLDPAPEIVTIPKRVAELQRTIAEFGSQIKGFDSTLETTRKQAVAAAAGVEEVKSMVHQLEARTNDTITNLTVASKKEEEITLQVQAVNSTLGEKLETLRTRIEEVNKPTTTSSTTTTTVTTPSTTTTTSAPAQTTTALPLVPPAKPSVLQ